jgi:hypothetical protein
MTRAHKYMAIAVVQGTARRDVGRLGSHRGDPRLHRPGDDPVRCLHGYAPTHRAG